MNDKDTLYARWLAGKLEEGELEELQKSGALEELEAVIKAADEIELSDFDLEKAYGQLKADKLTRSEGRIKSLRSWFWMAAAASVLLLIGVWTIFQWRPEKVMANVTNTMTHEFVDGSSVVLNDGSSITYYPKSWAKKRALQLEGEAWFKVEKGVTFSVTTPNGIVEVLGTQFNVRGWGDGLRVTCFEGRVKVLSAGKEEVLTKGEFVSVSQGIFSQKSTATNTTPEWTNGISKFNRASIEEVFKEMERQFGVTINVPVSDKTFSGSFSHQSLETALKEVCLPLNLRFGINSDQSIVTIQT